MIAVDMLTHAFRRNMHQAVLLTADLDFKPLIDALVREGLHITLWYPHGKPNTELIYAADEKRPLTFKDIHSWSTDYLQTCLPLPRAQSTQGKHIQGGILLETWRTKMNTDAEVFEIESDGSFTVVFPSAANRDKNFYTHVNHLEIDFLKLYVHECFMEFWDRPL